MYRLMLDHLKGFVIVMDGDMPVIYESVIFLRSKNTVRHSLMASALLALVCSSDAFSWS